MILGYVFINEAGYPVSSMFPTLEAAQESVCSSETGRFYSLEQTEDGMHFLRLICSVYRLSPL